MKATLVTAARGPEWIAPAQQVLQNAQTIVIEVLAARDLEASPAAVCGMVGIAFEALAQGATTKEMVEDLLYAVDVTQ